MLSASSEFCCDWSSARALVGFLNFCINWRTTTASSLKKWEINRAAGRYIRSHEEVQRISMRNRLNDFMRAHGAALAAALAPELMNYSGQHSAVQHCAMQHSLDNLREALQVWLSAGKKLIIPHRITTF